MTLRRSAYVVFCGILGSVMVQSSCGDGVNNSTCCSVFYPEFSIRMSRRLPVNGGRFYFNLGFKVCATFRSRILALADFTMASNHRKAADCLPVVFFARHIPRGNDRLFVRVKQDGCLVVFFRLCTDSLETTPKIGNEKMGSSLYYLLSAVGLHAFVCGRLSFVCPIGPDLLGNIGGPGLPTRC